MNCEKIYFKNRKCCLNKEYPETDVKDNLSQKFLADGVFLLILQHDQQSKIKTDKGTRA